MGVTKQANEKELQKAFKKKAIQYHPDKNPDDPDGAKETFQKIANAYETLTDPEKRRVYDQLGSEGVRQQEQRDAAGQGRGGGAHGMNMDDILKNMGFGGGGGGGGGGFKFHFGGPGGGG